jgi:hypothetical protein
METSCDASHGLNRTVAEQLSMLPVGLIIDLSLVRRIDADGLEALTIAATLADESDIAFWAGVALYPVGAPPRPRVSAGGPHERGHRLCR